MGQRLRVEACSGRIYLCADLPLRVAIGTCHNKYLGLSPKPLPIRAHGRIQAYELRGEDYEPIEHSHVLSGIDLRVLERFVDSPTTSRAMREYRDAIRG